MAKWPLRHAASSHSQIHVLVTDHRLSQNEAFSLVTCIRRYV